MSVTIDPTSGTEEWDWNDENIDHFFESEKETTKDLPLLPHTRPPILQELKLVIDVANQDECVNGESYTFYQDQWAATEHYCVAPKYIYTQANDIPCSYFIIEDHQEKGEDGHKWHKKIFTSHLNEEPRVQQYLARKAFSSTADSYEKERKVLEAIGGRNLINLKASYRWSSVSLQTATSRGSVDNFASSSKNLYFVDALDEFDSCPLSPLSPLYLLVATERVETAQMLLRACLSYIKKRQDYDEIWALLGCGTENTTSKQFKYVTIIGYNRWDGGFSHDMADILDWNCHPEQSILDLGPWNYLKFWTSSIWELKRSFKGLLISGSKMKLRSLWHGVILRMGEWAGIISSKVFKGNYFKGRTRNSLSRLAFGFILTATPSYGFEQVPKETLGDFHYQKFPLEPANHIRYEDTLVLTDPLTVLALLFGCSTSLVALYTWRRKDRQQKYFLGAGVILSTITGAFFCDDVQEFVFGYLFRGVFMALLVSLFYHRKKASQEAEKLHVTSLLDTPC